MSDGCEKTQKSRRQRSIYQVHYALKKQEAEMSAKPFVLPFNPADIQAYGRQVAGHRKSEGTKYLGLLQCNNGTIMKPIIKECQKREIEFYNRVSTSSHPDLVELRKLVPKYYGSRKFTYNGFEQDYIILEDLSQRMLEPCIMDVKIGKRTWDPLASEEKIKNEQSKYAQCKQEYGFCIPGFQVYRLPTGNLHKYNKDYGKRLHGRMVRDALRNYLNGAGASLCRALLLQFLSELWKIQTWARHQRALRLYCASLLLVYDAQRLRDTMLPDGDLSHRRPPPPACSSPPAPHPPLPPPPPPPPSPWSDALDRLNQNHSFEHNYEDKLCKIKMNYRALLEQLSNESPTPNPWGTVKIIDFAHAFFTEDDEADLDHNFKDGIDHFVEIFETFLKETDDQAF